MLSSLDCLGQVVRRRKGGKEREDGQRPHNDIVISQRATEESAHACRLQTLGDHICTGRSRTDVQSGHGARPTSTTVRGLLAGEDAGLAAAPLLTWVWERQELQWLVNCSTKLYFPP
jgi:hypothetical protein